MSQTEIDLLVYVGVYIATLPVMVYFSAKLLRHMIDRNRK